MENFQYKFVVSHNNELKNKLQICADCQNTVVCGRNVKNVFINQTTVFYESYFCNKPKRICCKLINL